MAFTIPNAVDTVSGNYAVLDQAEPDSLDFEVLGDSAHTGVVYGGEVTDDPSSTGVAVSAGVAVHKGVPYPFLATTINLTPSPSDPRFDVVVVDVGNLSGGYATITHLNGAESATNPEFPRSKSVATAGTYDPSRHVILASVYRVSGAITNDYIVDKRSIIRSFVAEQGTTAPLSTTASDRTGVGSLYFKTGTPEGSQSGLYVKSSSGGWLELAQNVGPHVPIGGMLLWPSTGAIPTGFLEANGQNLSVTAYPALFNVLGYTWGGSGSTFSLPDFREKYVRGAGNTNATAAGTSIGANSVTLNSAQMPSHSHVLTHTHGVKHKHTANHGHTGGSSGGSHNHDDNFSVKASEGTHGHAVNAPTINTADGGHAHNASMSWSAATRGYAGHLANDQLALLSSAYYNVASNFTSDIAGLNYSVTVSNSGSNHSHTISAPTIANTGGGHNHTVDGSVSESASHSHTINVDATNALSTSEDTPTTSSLTTDASNVSANTNTNTSTAGGNTAVTIIPSSFHARWIIRASYGSSAVAVGGTSLLDEALEEVVTVELAEKGATLANGAAAYYRMPWGATLRNVRAALNSGNMTNTTTITISGSVSGTITSNLRIDAGESSSTTASAPTIGVTDLTDDELLTFSVSGASTSDTGPLVVTLYMYRDA